MQRLAREAVDAGALGFSTSRTIAHTTRTGENIGTLKTTDNELRGIAQALRQSNRGAIQLISDAYLNADKEFAAAEVKLIRTMAEVSGRPLSFTVMQTNHAPRRWRMLLDAAAAMIRDGLTVRAQVAPRPIGLVMSFASSVNPFVGTGTFHGLLGKPLAERIAQLRDPNVKARIISEFQNQVLTEMQKLNPWRFDRMFRMNDPVDYEPQPDRSLQAEAQRAGRDEVEFTYDVMLENEGRRMIYVPVLNYADGTLDSVYEMLTDPNTLFGLSDAGAHVQTIVDGTFPTTTMALWTKGTRDGRKIPVEALVHGYTQRNAAEVGWLDRGVIAPGYLADLNVIDLDNLGVSPPHLVDDLPAGGARFLQDTHGYTHTIKRGQVTFTGGKFNGELPGRLMRGAQPAPHC